MRVRDLPGGVRELLPRLSLLAPRIRGARILEVGGTGETAEALLDAGASSVVRYEGGIHPTSTFDLVWVHDAGYLPPLGELAGFAEGGCAVISLRGWGVDLRGEREGWSDGDYRELVASLRATFPSVQVVVEQAVVGVALSSWGGEGRLRIDSGGDPSPEPLSYLFICGALPTPVEARLLAPMDAGAILGEGASLRRRLEEVEDELDRLRRNPPVVREPSADRSTDDLERRIRELREREDSWRSRAEEAELRLREVERRMEASQASQADLNVALRRQSVRADRAQRDAEGVMDAVYERDLLLREWRRRAEEAERRAAELEVRLSRRSTFASLEDEFDTK